MTTDCIFCRIVAGEIPAAKILETPDVLAFRDAGPQAPVHVLVIPKRHLASVMELTEADGELLTHCITAAREVARQHGLDESGFRLVSNHGAQAGQSVFHLHFHVLGGRRMQWPPG